MEYNEFKKLTRVQKENVVIPEIVRGLQDLGGIATRSELINYLSENSSAIPNEFIYEVKTSRQGNEYQAFDFTFNFARKHLVFAGYLEDERGKYILTSKGRDADLSVLDVDKDIHALSDPIWKELSESNKKKKMAGNEKTSDNVESMDHLELEAEWVSEIRKALRNFSPKKFEQFARLLVRRMGVKIDPKKGVQVSNDGGIDGFGYITKDDDFRTSRVAIQAKRWQGGVGRVEIQNFIGAMSTNNNQAEYGIFVTTSYFNKNAIETARSSNIPITLIDGDEICWLIVKYEIYVKPVTTYELDEYYYED